MHLLKSILFVLTIALYSCNDPHEYNVDQEFARYVAQFEQEAAKRGQSLNLQTQGLIIEFANLKDGKAGLCHYEKPIRIEIDLTYWNAIGKKNGGDLMRENLIFHELGHGILNRKHLNSTRENDDWKSLMCGGTKVDNRTWNINYRGMRRTYYVDELFDESTPMPHFMSNQLLTDTNGLERKLWLTFDTPSKTDTGWDLVNRTDYTTSTENKRFKFVSRFGSSYAILLAINGRNINFGGDFSIEAEIECSPQTATDQFGILFATQAPQNDTTEYFRIDNAGNMFPGNSSYYSYYVQLRKSSLRTNTPNKLKMFKINGIVHYFINHVYAYQTESGILGGGNHIGFIVPGNSTLWLDNLIVSQRSTMASTPNQQKVSAPISFETRIVPFTEPQQIQ